MPFFQTKHVFEFNMSLLYQISVLMRYICNHEWVTVYIDKIKHYWLIYN